MVSRGIVCPHVSVISPARSETGPGHRLAPSARNTPRNRELCEPWNYCYAPHALPPGRMVRHAKGALAAPLFSTVVPSTFHDDGLIVSAFLLSACTPSLPEVSRRAPTPPPQLSPRLTLLVLHTLSSGSSGLALHSPPPPWTVIASGVTPKCAISRERVNGVGGEHVSNITTSSSKQLLMYMI